jgi:hypothetical protein
MRTAEARGKAEGKAEAQIKIAGRNFYLKIELQVRRHQAGMSGNTRQHSRAYLIGIVEGKNIIGPASAFECLMGAGLPFFLPSDFQ